MIDTELTPGVWYTDFKLAPKDGKDLIVHSIYGSYQLVKWNIVREVWDNPHGLFRDNDIKAFKIMITYKL